MNQIDAWVQQYQQLQDQVLHLIDSLQEAQWRWSPGPKEWPVALCINHINTVNGLVVPRLEEAIHDGKARGIRSAGPFRYPIFDRLFVLGLEPKAPVKSQSPAIYRPEDAPVLSQVRQRFLELQGRLIAAAQEADGLDLVKIKIASPVSDRLRFSLGTWFNACLAHEQNHFEQAQRMGEKARQGL